MLPPPSAEPSDPVSLTTEFVLIALQKGTRSCVTKHPLVYFVSYQALSLLFSSFMSHISIMSIPRTIKDALFDPGCRNTMEVEMEALHQNATWELVPLPPGKQLVGCKWVYSVKFNPDGSLNKLKAQLVSKKAIHKAMASILIRHSPFFKISSI